MTVLYRRANGTFVIAHPSSGLPYHVTADDPLFTEYQTEAQTAPLEQPPAPAAPAPPGPISDRQFYQMLAVMGLASEDDALLAVKVGQLPVALQTIVNNLTGDDRFAAEMLLSGATTFDRSHPLVAQLGGALGWSPGQIDDFWREAAQL